MTIPKKNPSEAKWQYFYHPDHLGSSAYVTDYNGSLYQHLEYFAFGETFVEQSSNTQRTPYEFTAKELDEETGLYYFGARYYDARTSVWQSPDPILSIYLDGKRGMGGVFNSFNLGLYTYTHLNPVRFIDPDGNAPNQAGATNPSVILSEIKRYESAGMSQSEVLSKLSANHGGNENRYFSTDKYGWVDVRHFGKAAGMASSKFIGSVDVEILGVGNEIVQWLTEWGDDYKSGFSPEDIPSNAAGARFGDSLDSSKSLSSQFESWLKKVGGRDISDPKSHFNSLPSTDPSIKGGANRGSSNPSSKGPGANRNSSNSSSGSSSSSSSGGSSSSSSGGSSNSSSESSSS